MNKTILIIVVILVLVIGGYFFLKGGYRTPTSATPALEGVTTPTSAVKEFTVSGTEFSLSPSSITVKAGDRVKITFRNTGGASHNLAIEGLGVSTKTIGSGKTDTVEFTVPTSGTYPIFCSVPGHRSAGMEGQLKVE